MNIDDLYRLLRAGHLEAQGIIDTISDPLVVLDAHLRVQSASRSFYQTFRVDRFATIGKPFYELGEGQWDISELRHLLEAVIPKTTAIINYQVEHDSPHLGRRTMLVTARTLAHPDHASHSMLLSIVDATEQFARDNAKDLLFGELRHRVKNLLSVAQAIARQTTTEGRTAEQFRTDFLGRFRAMADAHDIAFGGRDETGLQGLVRRVIAPYEPEGAVVVERSPDIELGSRTLLSLSLILHELATNAAKYGALSVPGGSVHVAWDVKNDNRQLRIRWEERGGPPVQPPSSRGYGSQLMESTAVHSLQGRLEQYYAEAGLRTELVIPLGGDFTTEVENQYAESRPDR